MPPTRAIKRTDVEFSLSADQRELKSAARRFLSAVSTPEYVLKVMASERGYDADVWSRAATELGWAALTIPEEYGGLGMGALDLYPLMEEMGRHVFCSPFFSTVCLGANAITLCGNDAQKSRWLEPIAMGGLTIALAINETRAEIDTGDIQTTFETIGTGFKLNGVKRYVVDGCTAGLLLIVAREKGSAGTDGIALFAVERTETGVDPQWTPTMDQTRKQATIALDNVTVPADSKLDGTTPTWAALEKTVQLALAALCAEQVGGAEACLEMAVEYAKVRQQFGKPIGSFQAIKHKCADMLLRVESARSAALYASAVVDAAPNELREASALAKAYCSETYDFCAGENIQIHGGIGFTWEHAAHLYYKRARSSRLLFGLPQVYREIVAQEVGL
ncbi:MAG: acyl-CoA dehydrogenase family protein [Polyangiales bacterium]